jgi:MFS family permease
LIHPRLRGVRLSVTAISDSSSDSRLSLRSRAGLRTLAPILAAVFATDAMTALVVIGYGNSYLIKTLDSPASYPAYALGVYGLVKLLSAPIGGRILDRVRSSFVAVVALALDLVGYGVILGTHSASGYLVGVGVLSTGIALAWLIVFHAVGGTSTPSERGAASAYMGLTSIGAMGMGFGIAALVGETRYWQVAFGIGIALALLSTVALLRLTFSTALKAVGATSARPAEPASSQAVRRFAFVFAFAHFAVMTAMLGAFGPFALRTLGLSLLQIALFLLPAAAGGAGAMYLAGRSSRHGRRLRELAALYALAAVALLAMGGVHHPLLFGLIAVPLAVALGGVYPLMNASLLDAARAGERSGSALGWLFFAEGLGSVMGPLAIGTMIDLAGVRAGILGMGVGVLVLAAAAGGASRVVRL